MLALLSLAGLVQAGQDAAKTPSPFELHAFALRNEFVNKTDAGLRILALNPGIAELVDLNTLDEISSASMEAIWSPFFANTIVRTFAEDTLRPTVVYYNPLLDIAFLTMWKSISTDSWRIIGLRTVAGKRIVGQASAVPLLPSWMDEEDVADRFSQIAQQRLAAMPAFVRAWQQDVDDAYEDALYDFKDVQKRLVWGVNHRQQWSAKPWLAATLANIQHALNSHDATALYSMAPDTDDLAAHALAELPQGFAEHLSLDMILEDDGRNRILIGSREDSGDLYIWVICRVDGDNCLLSRFGIVSIDTS